MASMVGRAVMRRVEAERLGRIKDEFLANLSHEIRTPLNAILGWSQLLEPGKTNQADLIEGLKVITRNARTQARLIDDLLDMSRIISGKMRLDVQKVNLPAVIDAALESVKPAAQAKGIKLQKVIDPIAGPVTGDPNRLLQVVWNLLTNAIKFTPKGGNVQVVVERSNSHVELSISDTGKGIAAEFLPHVFERFSQADNSARRGYTGLGLGLAIVKSLAELHGGSVRVKSGGEGKGSLRSFGSPGRSARPWPTPPRLHAAWR
jgi:signal transduction histidine kinase